MPVYPAWEGGSSRSREFTREPVTHRTPQGDCQPTAYTCTMPGEIQASSSLAHCLRARESYPGVITGTKRAGVTSRSREKPRE